MPGMSGVELIERLKAEGHQLPAIMITGSGAVPMAVQAMKAGAVDFIEKPAGHEELLASVKRALHQTPDTATLSARRDKAAQSVASLTTRQRQILDLVLVGHPSKNIAADRGIGQRTLDNHHTTIMRKTGSKSLPALIGTASNQDPSSPQCPCYQLPSSLRFPSGRSGRYGMTPCPLLVSTMILSVPLMMRSMVSRYMRLRVTSGAFLYSS
jgi:two-component system, chemotaxis family, CheB/CheR fusion protein